MKVELQIERPVPLGNKGVTLTISDAGHVGHLRIGRVTVGWKKGRQRTEKEISLSDLIEFLDEAPSAEK